MSNAIARAQIAALARHPLASTTAKHFAREMLRGPVTLEIDALIRREVAAILGIPELGKRP